MERIIKFRAWQNDPYLDEPIMHDWQSLDKLDEDGFVHLFDILKGEEKYFTPMQFTGLCDKNGKEIYEGDIVSCYSGKYAVEFDDGGFSPFAVPEWEQEPHPKDCEIIGNVFQNPELIND